MFTRNHVHSVILFGCLRSQSSRLFSSIEIWTPIPGYPKYRVSSLGNIRNVERNRNLRLDYSGTLWPKRRQRVNLSHNSVSKSHLVNRVVLSAFHPMENQNELQANHIDGDITNNRLENLEWVTPKQNMQHATAIGVQKSWRCPVLIKNVTSGEEYDFESMELLRQHMKPQINVSAATITLWCKNKTIRNNYQFLYQEQDKYLTTIPDEKNERWKLYHVSERGWQYRVSNLVRVKVQFKNGKERLNRGGGHKSHKYMRVLFNRKLILLHRLVAMHFVPNPNNYQFVDHIDGDHLNNKAINLRWVTHKQNCNNPVTRARIHQARMRVGFVKR